MTTEWTPADDRISRREILKRTGYFAFATIGVPLLEACTPGVVAPQNSGQGVQAATQSPQELPVKGGNLIDARNVEDNSLLPGLPQNTPIATALFEGLLTTKPDGSLIPILAKSLPKVSVDGLSYTFDLRTDVKWSDGVPLTADDVVFTYKTLYHPDYAAFPSSRRGVLAGILTDVQATDSQTVVMTTNALNASFLANQTRDLVIPAHILGQVAPDALATHAFNKMPTVSSGPFKFKEWQASDHVTLVRNDLYYRGAPNLDSYVVRFIPQTGIITGLQTGEIDSAMIIDFSRYDELKTVPNVNFIAYGVGQGPRIWYNLDPSAEASKLFSDKAVRQALWYAADISGINTAVLYNYGSIPSSTGVFPTSWWPNDPNGKPALGFDKAKAEAMLDSAGWRRDSSGIRSKDSNPLKFEIMTDSNSTAWVQTAQVLQQSWKDIGADVSVRSIPTPQLIAASLDRSFDVLMQSTPYSQSGNPDPDPSEAFHSRTAVKGSRNYSSYKNPQVDQLLDQAISTLDVPTRKQLYIQLQAILNEDIPSFNTPFWAYGWATNKRVRGMGADYIGTFGSNRWFMYQAWVTDGK